MQAELQFGQVKYWDNLVILGVKSLQAIWKLWSMLIQSFGRQLSILAFEGKEAKSWKEK